jgi:hypothetical protein
VAPVVTHPSWSRKGLKFPAFSDPHDTAPLIDKVRNATAHYIDINVAIAEGWVTATPERPLALCYPEGEQLQMELIYGS